MSILGDIVAKVFQHPAAAAPTAPAAPGQPQVDVTAILQNLAQQSPEHLDWQHSIVDLLKLLDLNSSLAHRQELARELHYSGDTGDSAALNTWLHGEVMRRLAAHGGTVPDELKE